MRAFTQNKLPTIEIKDAEGNITKQYYQEPIRVTPKSMNLTPFVVYNEDGSLNRLYINNYWYNMVDGKLVIDMETTFEDGNPLYTKKTEYQSRLNKEQERAAYQYNNMGNRRGVPEA